MAFPDAWRETCLISIAAKGGSDVEFASATETVDIDTGDKDFDVIANLAGGRIEKWTPEAETVITFEGYFLSLDTASNKGIQQLFHTTRANWDTTQPLEVSGSRERDLFRVVILWTNDPTATSAAGSTGAADSLRLIIENARLISAKTAFTDGILKTTFKFKVVPFQKDGTSNIRWQSAEGTALAALGAYT